MGKTKGISDFTKTSRKKKKNSPPRSKDRSRRSSPTQGSPQGSKDQLNSRVSGEIPPGTNDQPSAVHSEKIIHDGNMHDGKNNHAVPPVRFSITQNTREPVTLHFTDESESENEDSVSIVAPSHFNNMNESECAAGPSTSAFMGPTASTSADDNNNDPTSNAEIETNESTEYRKRSFIGKIREKISKETVVIRKERHDKKKGKDDRKKAKEEKKLAKKMKKKTDKLEQEEEKAKEEEDKKKDQENTEKLDYNALKDIKSNSKYTVPKPKESKSPFKDDFAQVIKDTFASSAKAAEANIIEKNTISKNGSQFTISPYDYYFNDKYVIWGPPCAKTFGGSPKTFGDDYSIWGSFIVDTWTPSMSQFDNDFVIKDQEESLASKAGSRQSRGKALKNFFSKIFFRKTE